MYLQKSLPLILTTIFITIFGTVYAAGESNGSTNPKGDLSEWKVTAVEKLVRRQMQSGQIPGMSVVIVKDNAVIYQKGFGFADLKRKEPVTARTLFELGSNSKAFTALGVLVLEDQGLIQLNDRVDRYLPWFKMNYIRKEKDPTIEKLNEYKFIPWFKKRQAGENRIIQLLRHTSGISGDTIADIPALQDDNALEKTIRRILPEDLAAEPEEVFEYATINYDILGLIIEKVSGKKYEEYMKEEVIGPLGLQHTHLYRNIAVKHGMATGYKMGFLQPLPYEAPVYRGNTPAGYLISNGEDMAKWLVIQLGAVRLPLFNEELIRRSHLDNYGYSYGWNIFRTSNGKILWHAGSNPNFFSYIELRPQEQLGVAVLSNLNSIFTEDTGIGIMSILLDRGRIPEVSTDPNQTLDRILIPVLGFLMVSIIASSRLVHRRFKRKSRFLGINPRNVPFLICWLLILIAILILSYFLPMIIFDYTWPFVLVWGPVSIAFTMLLTMLEILLWMLYLFHVFFFKDKKGLKSF